MSLSINCFANTDSHDSHTGEGGVSSRSQSLFWVPPFKLSVTATKDRRGEWEVVGGVEADRDSN